MTRKEFQYAVERGLGRCIIAARRDPARYRDIVVHACRRCPSFDAQCEGTRAWYMYQLISCYDDRDLFAQLISQKLLTHRSTGGWNVQYYAELLCFFVDDGSEVARAALWKKYGMLYRNLLRKK